MGEGGGSATTFAKFVAVTACQAFSATYTVTTAGTQTASGGAQLNFVKISGTTTTTATFANIGTTGTFVTRNQVLSGSAGGLSLAQGDILQTVQGTDATLRGAIAYEVAFQPLASVTA
jgi:hypothetical protein